MFLYYIQTRKVFFSNNSKFVLANLIISAYISSIWLIVINGWNSFWLFYCNLEDDVLDTWNVHLILFYISRYCTNEIFKLFYLHTNCQPFNRQYIIIIIDFKISFMNYFVLQILNYPTWKNSTRIIIQFPNYVYLLKKNTEDRQ